MAGEDRTTAHTLRTWPGLEDNAYEYDFYMLVRILEATRHGKLRLGESSRSKDDVIRLTQNPSLAFAPTTISRYVPGDQDRPPKISVNFFGLFGPNGPMPTHITEHVNDRVRARDTSFLAFADIFHHRMLSLFYRAWANAQPVTEYDRVDDDRFKKYIGAFIGRGMKSMLHRDCVPDTAKLFYAGQGASKTCGAESLRSVISGYFKVKVMIEEYVGQWLTLPENGRCLLGVSPETGTLGMSLVIGERVWDCQCKFCIVFLALSFDQYCTFLPGNKNMNLLVSLVRNYIGDSMSWDVKLILKQSEMGPIRLGTFGMLGWTSWLGGPLKSDEVCNMTFSPEG